MSTAAYRPAGWATNPQLWSVTAVTNNPGSQTAVVGNQMKQLSDDGSSGAVIDQGNSQTTPGNAPSSSSTTYYFDGVMSSDHYDELTITRHPVQSGASIVDHAYKEPSTVVLDVLFTDALDSFLQGQYANNPSKSIAAYQTFLQLQLGRTPLTLTTHLQTYSNMLIKSVRASDTNMTAHGAKISLRFEQIILAQVSTQTVSARPNQTQTTNTGGAQPTPVPPTTTNTFTVPPLMTPAPFNPNPLWNSNPSSPAGLGGVVPMN